MNQITVGYGDPATFPTWAKLPEDNPPTELFFFYSTTGCGHQAVNVCAEMYADGMCSEIKAVQVSGVDIGPALSRPQHEQLMHEAEVAFSRRMD